MEHDENWVPRTREDYNLPNEDNATKTDYAEIFEDTPVFMLASLVLQQLLGWPAYLIDNTLGSPAYPRWINVNHPLRCQRKALTLHPL